MFPIVIRCLGKKRKNWKVGIGLIPAKGVHAPPLEDPAIFSFLYVFSIGIA